MDIIWLSILVFIFMIAALGFIFYIIEEKDKVKESKTMIQRISEEKHRDLAVARAKMNSKDATLLSSYAPTAVNEKKERNDYPQYSKIDRARGNMVRSKNYNSTSNRVNDLSHSNYRNSTLTDYSDYGLVSSKTNDSCSESSNSSSSSCND